MASPEPVLSQFTVHPSMTLYQAGPIWLDSRKPYISEVTVGDYEHVFKVLYKFFGRKQLDRITADEIRGFQHLRSATVGAWRINKECSVLQQILKRVKLWHFIEPDYQPLPLPKEPRGRALTDEEEYRLFKVASLNPNWEPVYNVALLSAHTAAGPGEIRRLRLGDVFLGDGEGGQQRAWIKIREAKNAFRYRTLFLDREAFQAATRLCEIARERGAHLAEHFLLPYRVKKGTYDPSQPQVTFKTSWTEMTAAAEIENFRMYDLRHHCLTRLAEKNPTEVVVKIAGHASQAMIRKIYAHVRDKAVIEAIDSLSRPDGWKPKPQAVRKLMPKIHDVRQVASVQKQAKQIVEETAPEDTRWIDLVGGDDEKE